MNSYMHIRKVNQTVQKGFTLLELLLSVATIGIIAGFSLPLSLRTLSKNDLDTATNTISNSFHRAQVLSQTGQNDSSWGVKVQTGGVTLFKGSSYITRDTTYDETYTISQAISLSGISEEVFEKQTGLAKTTGVITLTQPTDTKTITINEKGMLE